MDTPASTVNKHYLDNVVACSESQGVEASEDILATNGTKLLAKGALVDMRVRERLLEHKLKKPIETSLRVVDGTALRHLDQVAHRLLEQHALLARVCGEALGKTLTTSLRNMTLSSPLESMLGIYAARNPLKLDHAVAAALLAAALAQKVPGTPEVAAMLLAGLLHDVGELYIDPAFLAAGVRLEVEEWKHIAAHPIIGARVIATLPGAGAQVSQAVLHHHERQDGFGYPGGLSGSAVSVAGQALAVAEFLVGLLESGANHAHRANVALKLVPGEFNRALLDHVVTASRAVGAEGLPAPWDGELADIVRDVSVLRERFSHASDVRALMFEEGRQIGTKAFMDLATLAFERWDRIRVALSSTAVDSLPPNLLHEELQAMSAAARLEISIVVRELRWRLGELERQATVRAERLGPTGLNSMRRLINAARGRGTNAVA